MAEEKITTTKKAKTGAKNTKDVEKTPKVKKEVTKSVTKKTTNSEVASAKTPKTVTKKVDVKPIEEVVVEKQFCTNCGRELKSGEVCLCTSKKEVKNEEPISINTEAIVGLGQKFMNTIINMFKKPSTTLNKELENKDIKSPMIMLIVISLTYGLNTIANFNAIIAEFVRRGYQLSYFTIPYFKIFIYMSLIYFILAFIPISAAYVVAKLTNNHEFNYQKSINLYATSMAPTVVVNLLMGLLAYLNILSGLGTLICLVISIACFFNYMLGYLNANKISENKKSYTLTLLLMIWLVTFMIAVGLFTYSVVNDLTNDFEAQNPNNNYNYNYNNGFHW